jgi:hypothetical protein
MKINLISRKYSFIRLFIYFLSFSIFSCSCTKGKNGKPSPKPTPGDNTKKAIILFHGIAEPGGMDYLKKELSTDFLGLEVIALDRQNSQSAPIEQQAKEAFLEIKKQKLLDKELLLLGYSQGGLVAFSMYNQHQAKLKNVKGLITYYTPWEGVPVSKVNKAQVENLVNTIIKAAPVIKSLKGLDKILKESILGIHAAFTTGKGCEDLKPNSTFLMNVRKGLSNNQIPILALAGEEVELNKAMGALLGKDLNLEGNIDLLERYPLTSLEPIWASFIGAQPRKHDFLIPLGSQTAESIKNKNKFKVEINKGIHHYTKITSSPEVYNQVKEAVKTYLGASAFGKGKKPSGKGGKNQFKRNK